ncbi:MAG: ZIP family metal transporter [bacterium]|nr:ZIP family metal transporter [bacterium]
MDNAKLGLLTTLLLGIFILIGALVAFIAKKKEKVSDFSIGLALGVMVMLVILDLLPEIIENLGLKYIYVFLLGTAFGYFILKILDKFIPDHDHNENANLDKKELKSNLIHIGVVTSLALVLHNIVEGMAVYATVLTDTKIGLAVTLGIGFHNIPLGMVIAATFYQSNENIWKTISIISAVSLSTFIGGLIMFFLNISTINPILLGTLLSITLGMVLFITLSELIPRIRESKDKKVCYIGITIGVIILLISSLI